MAPRSTSENERIREERRRKIIIAAARVFARRGLAASKIADIAAAAEMSHGLVYHYFPSKEELFATLVQWASDGSLALVRRSLTEPGTPWDRLTWLVSVMLRGVREQPHVFMVMIQALTTEDVPAPARELALRQAEDNVRLTAQLIAEGQAAGLVKAGDPLQLAGILLSSIQGLALCLAVGADIFVQSFPSVETMLSILRP